ncbi:MAG: hypothetical protein BGP24_14835 [Lysobacterales bacterium 69-70]|nr:hypothetical protein [Xanthomonadaceae bacterium]ODU35361.1 MAG: hypothetical protein ABS97_05665 [Xanthomonadaceae bacterium SCN 69-320]ODV17176.1 MAG: hypothetical protein ABT27_17575 [Xanthomonadaceae bacterium SCN 69-25]OJY94257.1 MAG: hypothetical protein BGP24_14835 [Xanthomonadales bacterium 69-70]
MRFLATFILRALSRPSTPAEQIDARAAAARNRVLRACRGRYTGMRLAEAQARAEAWVRRGISVDDAVYRANAWARDAMPARRSPEVAA